MNPSEPILDLNGNLIPVDDEKGSWTYGRAMVLCLLNQPNPPADEKVERFVLATKISAATDDLLLDNDEIKLLDSAAKECFGPLIYCRVLEQIDPVKMQKAAKSNGNK